MMRKLADLIRNSTSAIENPPWWPGVDPNSGGIETYSNCLRLALEEQFGPAAVVFVGPLYGDDHKAALAAADLFVLPSLNESFGNAAGEAVAAGVPVLLTDTCGIAPIIQQRAGLAVPLGVDFLAQGLRTMLDPAWSRELTARREEVKRDLSWDESIAQTIALYERIIAAVTRNAARRRGARPGFQMRSNGRAFKAENSRNGCAATAGLSNREGEHGSRRRSGLTAQRKR